MKRNWHKPDWALQQALASGRRPVEEVEDRRRSRSRSLASVEGGAAVEERAFRTYCSLVKKSKIEDSRVG